MFLVQCEFEGTFIAENVVVGDPEAGYGGPKGAGEVAEGVEEAVVDDLVDKGEEREG